MDVSKIILSSIYLLDKLNNTGKSDNYISKNCEDLCEIELDSDVKLSEKNVDKTKEKKSVNKINSYGFKNTNSEEFDNNMNMNYPDKDNMNIQNNRGNPNLVYDFFLNCMSLNDTNQFYDNFCNSLFHKSSNVFSNSVNPVSFAFKAPYLLSVKVLYVD